MSFESIIFFIISTFVNSLSVTVTIMKQLSFASKRSFFEKILFFFLMWIYCVIVFFFITNQLRFITSIVAMSLIMYFVLKIKDRKVILYAFNTVIIMGISEIIATLLMVLVGVNSDAVVNNLYFNLITCILITIFTIILINLPFIKILIKKIINLFNKRKELINYLYLFLLVLYLIVSKNGWELVLKSNYYVNILVALGIICIFILIMKNEGKYEQLEEENKQMYNHVTKYEKIITDQGKANHEFKNQLMVIKGYAQMNPDKLIEYIDSIVADTKNTYNSYLIKQLNQFPDGGIKGLLYYKLSQMEEEKINYSLDVETGVKTKLKPLSTSMYKYITKILGVLLDNAIDASKKSNEKEVIISVTNEKPYVIFSISNTYKGKIEVPVIGTGYSTKGRGHGYGLRLVKDIIDETKSLEVENKLIDKYYVSSLKIKVKQKKKK